MLGAVNRKIGHFETRKKYEYGTGATPMVGVPLITIAIKVDTNDSDQSVSHDYHPLR